MDRQAVYKLLYDVINDKRLELLAVSPEFSCVRFKLDGWMLRVLNGEDLSDEEITYLKRVYAHLQYIQPHKEFGIVDGYPAEIIYLTRVPDILIEEGARDGD